MQLANFQTQVHPAIEIRPAAVAGTFYPADPTDLEDNVFRFLRHARRDAHRDRCEESAGCGDGSGIVKAIIAPHAGYIYSGPIAGTAYVSLAGDDYPIKRVVLIGPAHFVPVRGLAISSADAFATPLGNVPIDEEGRAIALSLPQVALSDEAHAPEHSLEVQLPFLQTVCCDFTIVPLLVGDAEEEEVAEVLEALWDGPGTRIVVSSDLSHYLDYASARAADALTSNAITHLAPTTLGENSACGRIAIRGLLRVAAQHGLSAKALDLRNSGDTAGPHDRVVGYGAFAFEQYLS